MIIPGILVAAIVGMPFYYLWYLFWPVVGRFYQCLPDNAPRRLQRTRGLRWMLARWVITSSIPVVWGSFGALGSGSISAALGEQIAVAVADRNACEYCLAAHTALGQKAGVGRAELTAAQTGESSDPKVKAALSFALKLVNERGQVSKMDVQELRDAGFNDQEIVEIIAHVALNLFTNYINVALEVPVDFPAVQLNRSA